MIIVEGPDGGGKTTLVKQLEDELGVEKQKRHCDSQGPFDDLAGWVEEQALKVPRAEQVYDRHPLISETIYGPLIRGSIPAHFADSRWYGWAWRLLSEKDPLFVFCLPPISVAHKNLAEQSQMVGVWECYVQIYWSYYFLASRMTQSHRVFWYDYTSLQHNYMLKRTINQYWKEKSWIH